MQKKLIALAVAGLVSGGAFAQSNVTISGNVEAHFESVSAKGATAAGADSTSRTRITDNTSALRLAGSENLGNGLTAFFQIESDLGIDNGPNGTAGASAVGFGNRNSAVGLSGNFGSVLMGHWDAHYQSQLEGGVDFGSGGALPHSANSMNVTAKLGNTLVGGRLNNVIAYTTPSMSGFSARLAWAAGGSDQIENTAAGVPAKNTGWNLFAKYANGPINAFYSHLTVSNAGAAAAVAGSAATAVTPFVATVATVAATSGNDIKGDRLGLAYSFPMGFKVGLVYDDSKSTAIATGTTTKRKAWSLPISYKTGAHGVYFAYAKANNLNVGGADVANSGVKNTILGYTYSLSKRTQLGVSWSRISNDSASNVDFWTRGVGGVAAGADPTSFAMGVNHTF